ncbi:hypothetical protein HG531_012976 [Fusarium graminearum]|nr:hypothetical protein HG531_012976 [Fusarium graminearum]
MDTLHLRHLIIPLTHVCTNEIEDAFERGYEILGDVVLGVQLPMRIVEKLFGGNTPVDKSGTGRTSDDNVRNSLAILWFCTSILKHALGADEGTSRRCAFIRLEGKLSIVEKLLKSLVIFILLHATFDHDSGFEDLKALKVKHEERAVVEGALRFHNEWQTLESVLATDLFARRRHKKKVLWLGNPEHDRFDLELRSSRENREEIYAKESSLLTSSGNQFVGVQYLNIKFGAVLVVSQHPVELSMLATFVPTCQ